MSDPNVYTAERILAKRKHHGVTQYHIKWKGYSLKDSTWEPAENILDPTLLINFEQANKSKKSSTSTTSTNNTASSSTNVLNSSGSSSNASSVTNESRSASASTIGKAPRQQGRVRARRRSYLEQRQEQLQLQRHIELQQQQKTHSGIPSLTLPTTITTTTPATFTKNGDKRPQLLIFNPQGSNAEHTFVEEIYEPKLTKEPILVTDVTSQDLTVTISECRTPDGFFKTW